MAASLLEAQSILNPRGLPSESCEGGRECACVRLPGVGRPPRTSVHGPVGDSCDSPGLGLKMWGRAGCERGGCAGASGGWESPLHLWPGVQVWVEVRAAGGVSGELSVAQGSRSVCRCEAALSDVGVAGSV